MPRNDSERRLRERTRFVCGPSLECFFALATLTDRESTLHSGWQRTAESRLSHDFWRRFDGLGGWPLLWVVVPDAFGGIPPEGSVEQALERLEAQPIAEFRASMLTGILHFEDQVQRLIDGSATLAEVMTAVPRSKLDWYLFVGLYPFDAASPAARTIALVLKEPQKFRSEMLKLIREFWSRAFSPSWESLNERFEASLRDRRRLFESCSVARLFDLLRLRVEIDPAGKHIVPIRGDYRLPISEIGECLILPSAFNHKRFWYSRIVGGRNEVAFPYFDPRISLQPSLAGQEPIAVDGEPELDPLLVFKALGNTTRYAIAMLLARSPQTSVELAQSLSLSKPTISHHIHQLREAGLLRETPQRASILLSLNRDTLERLSDVGIRALYADSSPLSRSAGG